MSKKKSKIEIQIDAIIELVDDLGYEYDRMTSSGKETLNKLWELCGLPKFDDSNESYDKRMRVFTKEGWYTGKVNKDV